MTNSPFVDKQTAVPLDDGMLFITNEKRLMSPSDDKEESESQMLSERSQSEKVTTLLLVWFQLHDFLERAKNDGDCKKKKKQLPGVRKVGEKD